MNIDNLIAPKVEVLNITAFWKGIGRYTLQQIIGQDNLLNEPREAIGHGGELLLRIHRMTLGRFVMLIADASVWALTRYQCQQQGE